MKNNRANIINCGVVNVMLFVLLNTAASLWCREILLTPARMGGLSGVLALAAVISILWLSFYYFLDREDREPVQMIIFAFICGAVNLVVTSEWLGGVLFNLPFRMVNAAGQDTASHLMYNAVLPSLGFFLILRFIFYPSRHFNERVDGIMYGAFCGIGYASASALSEILRYPEVSVYYLIFTLSITLGIFSSLGAFCGYFFGAARYDKRNEKKYFALTAAASLILLILFSVFNKRFSINPTSASDTVTVAVTGGFMLLLLSAVFFLVQIKLAEFDPEKEHRLPFSIDIVTVIFAVVVLITGLVLRIDTEKFKKVEIADGISISVPAVARTDSSQKDRNIFNYYIPGSINPVRIMFEYRIIEKSKVKVSFSTVPQSPHPETRPLKSSHYTIVDSRTYPEILKTSAVTGGYNVITDEYLAATDSMHIRVSISVPAEVKIASAKTAYAVLNSFTRSSK